VGPCPPTPPSPSPPSPPPKPAPSRGVCGAPSESTLCGIYNANPYIPKYFCERTCKGINTKEKCEARNIHPFYDKEIKKIKNGWVKALAYAYKFSALPEELLSKKPKCQWNIVG
jgi:hypothetical protein